MNDALYLDIETTGLSADLHYVTVVGALYDGVFHQWTWPEPLDQLADWIRSAPLTVTFNGRRFDVPFLRRHFPAIPEPSAHVDLLYIARAAGFQGGQKAIERQLGLQREDAVRGVDGPEAVACWCKALYGDGPSYRQLLAYNRAHPVFSISTLERLNTVAVLRKHKLSYLERKCTAKSPKKHVNDAGGPGFRLAGL